MLKALRGTKDILPADINAWQYIEQSAREIFDIYGYKEIRTPIIEEAFLFIRSIGDSTDIVQKEMYVFSDRGGRSIALRPEATASVVRAYLENSLGHKESLSKLFYIGPMFRSERPQKGRQRQFHQLGIEAIGSDNPFLDAEVILLAVKFLQKLGIDNFSLKINSLGCKNDKIEIIKKYRLAIKPCLKSLCDECNARYDKNVLRVLDCKNVKCKEIVRNIDFDDSLCGGCAKHFEDVKKALDDLGVIYSVDPKGSLFRLY
ncbi:histidine--tRNA ligase, partial [Candidatus Omnitrophota bacterium]